MKKLCMMILSLTCFMMLGGCATIIGDDTQAVTISSEPRGVDFTIQDEKGKFVSSGKTPQTVTLPKSDGSYWGGKSFVVTFTKDGKSVSQTLQASPNGWYFAGNLVFGGWIGWFIVDPLNGGMYTLRPDAAHAAM